jgi:hypothetical protein
VNPVLRKRLAEVRGKLNQNQLSFLPFSPNLPQPFRELEESELVADSPERMGTSDGRAFVTPANVHLRKEEKTHFHYNPHQTTSARLKTLGSHFELQLPQECALPMHEMCALLRRHEETN